MICLRSLIEIACTDRDLHFHDQGWYYGPNNFLIMRYSLSYLHFALRLQNGMHEYFESFVLLGLILSIHVARFEEYQVHYVDDNFPHS